MPSPNIDLMIQLPSTESGHNTSIMPVTLTQGLQKAQSTGQVQQKIITAEKIWEIFMGATHILSSVPC